MKDILIVKSQKYLCHKGWNTVFDKGPGGHFQRKDWQNPMK